MKLEEWKTYRTRFLVQAKQLSSNLTFVDHLGRQHCGRRGDYLVESSDGVLSIAPRRIFEDIYVPMCSEPAADPSGGAALREPKHDHRFEPLEIEEVKLVKAPRPRIDTGRAIAHEASDRARRKLPQSCRLRPSSGLGLM